MSFRGRSAVRDVRGGAGVLGGGVSETADEVPEAGASVLGASDAGVVEEAASASAAVAVSFPAGEASFHGYSQSSTASGSCILER